MKEILLFSGGLDSFIAWHFLKKPECLYVDIGHRYHLQEMEAAMRLYHVTGLKVTIDRKLILTELEKEDAFIPMRNSFLAHIAALYGDKIWLIVQKGELEIPDRSVLFMERISQLLTQLNGRDISVDSPFIGMTKTDMVKWYIEQGLPVDHLKLTMSCYNGNNCGYCPACFRRWVAFKLNGIEENYLVDPWKTTLAKRYKEAAINGVYDKSRCMEILKALEGVE